MSDNPSIKTRLTADMKAAMKSKDKPLKGVIRLALAAIKQIEVDTRTELDETKLLSVIDKMVKQRRDSITQFEKADRQELADQEKYEISVLQNYLPEELSEAEIQTIVSAALTESGAATMREMGKVMAIVRPQVQGRADMGLVSKLIKAQLN